MKNSLFKRAFAAVAAVPVALTQCLTIANAVDVKDAPVTVAADNEVTLTGETGLLTIAPEKDYIEVSENTYEKISEWNLQVAGMIAQVSQGGNGTGTVDVSKAIDKAASKAGKYSDIVKAMGEKVGEVKYAIQKNGDVVVTGSFENVAPAFETIAQDRIKAAFDDLQDKYGEQEELKNDIENLEIFKGVEIAGEVKVVIKSSQLSTSTEIAGEVILTTADGKEYKGAAIAEFAKNALAELKAAADKNLASIVDKYDLDDEEITQKVKESAEYQEIIDKYSKPITLTEEEVIAGARASEEYKSKVAELVAAGASEEDAKKAVEDSETWTDLIKKYSQESISLTREEVEEVILKSEDYKNKYNEVKADYEKDYANVVDQIDSAKKELNDVVDSLDSKIDTALNKADNLLAYDISGSYADTTELLNAVKAKAPKKVANKVPATFTEGASKSIVVNAFDAVLAEINKKAAPYSVNISSADLGAYADQFENIKVSVEGTKATLTATFPDAEASDVAAYFKSAYNAAEVESWKEATVTFDASNAKAAGVGTVDVQIKRVVKITPADVTTTEPIVTTIETTTATEIVTTTATATDIVTTTATETATGTGVVTTTATVSATATGVVTTTVTVTDVVTTTEAEPVTTTATVSEVVTTTATEPVTTTEAEPVTTTATVSEVVTTTATEPVTTTEAEPVTTTATEPVTTTEAEPVTTTATVSEVVTTTATEPVTTTTEAEPVTTTTATTTEAEPVTTATVTESVVKVSYETETYVGFYLNIDESYNMNQLKKAEAKVIRQIFVKDLDGNILEIIPDGEETIDLLGKITFKNQKPSDEAETSVMIAREVKLFAAQDISDSKGVVIKAGDEIVNEDGTGVTMEAYVGVKGDVDFSGAADAADCSRALWIYAELSTGSTADDLKFSPSEAVKGADDMLDQFAAFLVDVDAERTENNFAVPKSGRSINAADASFILGAYSGVSTSGGGDVDYRGIWDEVLGQFAANYVAPTED